MNYPETSRIAGAATPGDPKAENPVERNFSHQESNMNDCSRTILDQRIDDLISIADLTGATLDAVVATVGRLPEATFTAVIDVLSTLCAPPAPNGLQGLVQQHRALTDRIVEAETDAGIAEIDAQIDEVERQIMSTPARTPGEAYAKVLAIMPEVYVDLQGPTLAPLRAEIEATIGGEAYA